MKKKSIYKNLVIVILLSLSVLLNACLRSSDADIKPSSPLPFKGDDVVKTLASQSTVHLFNQAFNRAGLAGSVNVNTGYTIFAPTDSAMKAVGLDSAGISKLDVDSLRSIISYQITLGIFDDKALSNVITSQRLLTLRPHIIKSPTGGSSNQPTPIYVKENNSIYINGVAVTNKPAPVEATNGYIYPVNVFTKPPSKSLYNIISSDPDLSLFKQALIIGDSIRDDAVTAGYGYTDSFNEDVYSFNNAPLYPNFLPTILAPTNKAFNDAGFHTIDDIRKFATRSYVGFDFNTFNSFYYSPLDSMLKHHILYNLNLSLSYSQTNFIFILYNDLLSSSTNNNLYNVFIGPATDLLTTPFDLQIATPLIFSANNGNAYVKWNSNPATPPVLIPHDAPGQQPVNNFVANNGALYKIDKLFYPIVK